MHYSNGREIVVLTRLLFELTCLVSSELTHILAALAAIDMIKHIILWSSTRAGDILHRCCCEEEIFTGLKSKICAVRFLFHASFRRIACKYDNGVDVISLHLL